MSDFVWEHRYIVLKVTDMYAYLDVTQRASVATAGATIARGRAGDGKPPFNAVVVEQDWPEFDSVQRMIVDRVMGTHSVSCLYQYTLSHLGLEDTPDLRTLFWSERGALEWVGDTRIVPVVHTDDCPICSQKTPG